MLLRGFQYNDQAGALAKRRYIPIERHVVVICES